MALFAQQGRYLELSVLALAHARRTGDLRPSHHVSGPCRCGTGAGIVSHAFGSRVADPQVVFGT